MPEQEVPQDTPERPHDVLAAEQYALPAPDPELHHHDPVQLPGDPSDPELDAVPHDVLAAEEFPMPAPRPHPAGALATRRGGYSRLAAEVGAAVALGLLVARRRRG